MLKQNQTRQMRAEDLGLKPTATWEQINATEAKQANAQPATSRWQRFLDFLFG